MYPFDFCEIFDQNICILSFQEAAEWYPRVNIAICVLQMNITTRILQMRLVGLIEVKQTLIEVDFKVGLTFKSDFFHLSTIAILKLWTTEKLWSTVLLQSYCSCNQYAIKLVFCLGFGFHFDLCLLLTLSRRGLRWSLHSDIHCVIGQLEINLRVKTSPYVTFILSCHLWTSIVPVEGHILGFAKLEP